MLGVFKLGTYWTCYTWLPKFLQNQISATSRSARSAVWVLTAQLGQFLGMMAFGCWPTATAAGWPSPATRC